MSPVVVVIAVVLALLGIGWLRRQPSAALRQTLSRVLLVVGLFGLLLLLLRVGLHPLLALAGGALIVLQRLLAAKQLFDRVKSARGPAGGKRSKVTTRILDMSLDHDSGAMDGRVREGRFTGRELSQLNMDELLELLAQCHADDEQSAGVLEAWLDREHPDTWRERAGVHARTQDQRSGGAGGGAAPGAAAMSAREACEILGVAENASRDEIVDAHRKLMQKLHPDRGGSTYLASKVNQAKDLLLDR